MSTTTIDTNVTNVAPRLTNSDRCDTCSAQAYIAATVNGVELLYCIHHGRKYEAKLRAVASNWHDESHRIN